MDDEVIEQLLERFVGAMEKIADELEVIRHIAAKEDENPRNLDEYGDPI